MLLAGKKMNCLGDSITAGACVPSSEYAYPALIAAAEEMAWVKNYGISATRIAHQRGETEDQNFCSRIDGLDADADIVTVLGGTNDYGHGNAPLGKRGDNTPETFFGACEYLCANLKKRFPNARIVIMTPLTRSLAQEVPKGADFGIGGDRLETFVAVLKETAERYNFPVLDLFRNRELDAAAAGARYYADGLHLNVKGHAVLARVLAEFLKTL